MLDGKHLPWVESAVHLGHILHQSGHMDKDIRVKRANLIDESVSVREMFQFANPAEVKVMQAVKLYVGSHYGSMLFDLGSDMARQYVLQCLDYLCQAGLAGTQANTQILCGPSVELWRWRWL
jgi:hypothetical protein